MGGIHDFFLVGLGIHIYIAVVAHVYTCYHLLDYIVLFFLFKCLFLPSECTCFENVNHHAYILQSILPVKENRVPVFIRLLRFLV